MAAVDMPVPPPRANGSLLLLGLLTVLVHAPAYLQYGWFRDELYYLSCAKRMAWGYVDQPPLSIALLWLVRHTLGDSLAAVRLIPLLAAVTIVWLCGELARQCGGGRTAQVLAALAAIAAPIYLGFGHYYSMNILDVLLWTLAALAFIRALRAPSGRVREWSVLGLLFGLGLLNKWSMLWCIGGYGVALLLTSHRRQLATPGPWLAALIAAVLVAPHVAWEMRLGWPTLEFMHNAMTGKMLSHSLGAFAAGQLLLMNPLAAWLWIWGLLAALVGAQRAWRVFAVQFLCVFALLATSRTARVEYLAAAYPPLLALGACAFERATSGRWGALRPPAFALVFLATLMVLPLAIPVLPIPMFIRYAEALGRKPDTEEHHRMGALPQHYADMVGWPGMARAAEQALLHVPPAERSRAVVIVDNYGEAGALERLAHGLPRIVCPHNNWWLWGTGDWDGGVALVQAGDSADVAHSFRSVERVGSFSDPGMMPYEQHRLWFIARGLRLPVAKAWALAKDYN